MSFSFTMRSVATLFLFYFLFFLTTITTFHQNCLFCSGSNSCIQSERQALLNFKKDLKDPSNRLSSWAAAGDHHHEEDCCLWHGIVCNNLTGHVREIHLRNPSCPFDGFEFQITKAYLRHGLGGKINPSLLDLKHLRYLDLSCNHFERIPIPSFIGSLASLKYLNLSWAGFQGTIPHQLGNLSMIRYLALAGRYSYKEPLRLRVDNLQWLSGLVSLQHLDLSYANLSKALDWVQVINKLHSLVELRLSHCQLLLAPPSPPIDNLTSLAILDLSRNHIFSFPPGWHFTLNSLVSLNIGDCYFDGPIPHWLLNFTDLQDLDLSGNFFNSTIPNWLYSFKHLKSLSLSFNNLQGIVSDAIGNLTTLSKLYLSFNQLKGIVPGSLGELCNLKEIVLEYNNFGGRVEEVFRNLSKCMFSQLEYVTFEENNLSGHLPDELGGFKNLAYLDLRENSISGPIPVSIGRLSSLKELDLSNNRLKGSLPRSLGQLLKLESLDISRNLLEGIVSDIHFANLTSLNIFNACENNLTWKPSDSWVPPFQLSALTLDSWQLGPQFPMWLQSQRKLVYLSMGRTGISDSIPSWFWRKSSQFGYLNLSSNQIHGKIPRTVKFQFSLTTIDFSSNHLEGSLPNILSNVSWLDLSNNFFSRSIYRLLCGKLGKEERVLSYLNIGKNCLSGKIPDCWKNWPFLEFIKLENNNLMGMVPQSIGHLTHLQALHLQQTNLSGELPQSLQHCTKLLIIDLGQNEFNGNIPSWMGYSFSKLVILKLRSNKFQGHIPFQLCSLSSLQILDLAYNNLSGSIPRCFHNFSAMASKHDTSQQLFYEPNLGIPNENAGSFEDIFLMTKGMEFEYNTILNLVTSMDLSENDLHGEIPKGLSRLVGLLFLNLSGNCLTGTIPENIGDMRQLESLDFSVNQLSGKIPLSMSALSFLSYLNLSYNDLVGQIPSSTQLQGFTESSFVGNRLCGPPLPTCNAIRATPRVTQGDDHDEDDGDQFPEKWFFASSALGFAFGFLAVLGPLLFKMSWRIAYFRFLDGVGHKLCNVIFYFRYK